MNAKQWPVTLLITLPFLFITCNRNVTPSMQVQAEQGFDTPYTVKSDPSPLPLTPEQTLASFRLPKGYHMELVASEPMITEPVAIAWDGNERMYVAQMETYMQTVDTTGEHEPHSRIMLLEDTNNDGRMDKSSVFIDKLMLPRMILCVGSELLVNETDTYDIYAYKDTNGDGVADQKRRVYHINKRAPGNLEHQRSGLDWNLDNWIYVTVDPVRFRYKNGMLEADTLASGSNGQWGLTHDNFGRLFFSRAGGENAGSGFQINPAYGQLEFRDAYIDSTFGSVWPIIKTPDIQGGLKRIRPDTTLNHFTAGNGQSIFRGDRLPKTLVGDYLINEPVARIIRRAKVINKAGKTTLENAYDKQEFIASTDMNFRPVNTYTGPDGCLYIVDMYRGIIQEGTWTAKGSYLRPQIQRLGLDKNIQRGRIYRLVYDGLSRGPKPKMLSEPGSKLVAYLDHPNGWWRDNAQKELVVRQDKSVIPVLKQIIKGETTALGHKPSALGRLHALWTLEGVDALDKDIILTAMKDDDEQVRRAAVWVSEPWLVANDADMLTQLKSMKDDTSYDVRVQLLLSLHKSQSPKATELVTAILEANTGNEMLKSTKLAIERNDDVKKYGIKLGSLNETNRKMIMEGAMIFQSLCSTCHGPEGQGLPSQVAPPLAGFSQRLMTNKDAMIKILLHGLTGPIEDKTYPDMMPPMGANEDEWIASVLSYVRYDLGRPNRGGVSPEELSRILVKPEDVKNMRQHTAGRDKAWTWAELTPASKSPN
ncbi:c-type cytochrome [Cytophagaceae bacterium DM2B3-1]|uniref:C-type cytochrome n=1 Tax=Xanthocytophaga flava TaxID=3048013 RepID=A0ABT7CU48_9BACT|nr:c-type cytochrome [Xanthocytophaga flavus]MDJ1469158.1 c-type cytochrome [Xanthocytophaga flavus]MDJ1497296.1 c-type cytochrome [Xanthocytophaga flavus]